MRRSLLLLLVVVPLAFAAAAQAAVHTVGPHTVREHSAEAATLFETHCPFDEEGGKSRPYRETCTFYYDDSDKSIWQETNTVDDLQKQPFSVFVDGRIHHYAADTNYV